MEALVMNTINNEAKTFFDSVALQPKETLLDEKSIKTNKQMEEKLKKKVFLKGSSHADNSEKEDNEERENDNNTALDLQKKAICSAQITNVSEELKNTGLKIVFKKTSDFNISPQTLVQTKNSPNTILLLTPVSKTANDPIYTATTYASDQKIFSIANSNSKQLNAIENNVCDEKVLNKTDVSNNTEEVRKIKCVNNSDAKFNLTEFIEANKPETYPKASTPKGHKELELLQKTVSESKVLSEFINDSTSKIRKSRKIPLKNENSEDSDKSLMFKHQRVRSRSCSKSRIGSPVALEKSINKWPSEERLIKRQNMRSQDSDFVQRQKNFLHRVQAEGEHSDNSDADETSITDGSLNNTETQHSLTNRNFLTPPKAGWDSFCWKCHTENELKPCSKCNKSFHVKCAKVAVISDTWVCPDCVAIDNSIKGISRSGKLSISHDHLNLLLQFAVKRMMQLKGSDKFMKKVNENDHPYYDQFIINPITLESLEQKILSKGYKCTEELAVEVKWILHNCIVYFGRNGKLLSIAKSIVKVCRQEVNEIETCAECYYNANTMPKNDWFVEVCSRPHVLLWAKLKGFPYWPAKAMGLNSSALVDVRFFGDHDRAYIPIKDCYLYSEEDPNPPTKQNKRNTIAGCIKEVDIHIRRITKKFGTFKYAAFRSPYDPLSEITHLEMMIPGFVNHFQNAQRNSKPALTYKIIKTADNQMSFIKKSDVNGDNENNVINNVIKKSNVQYTIIQKQITSTANDSPIILNKLPQTDDHKSLNNTKTENNIEKKIENIKLIAGISEKDNNTSITTIDNNIDRKNNQNQIITDSTNMVNECGDVLQPKESVTINKENTYITKRKHDESNKISSDLNKKFKSDSNMKNSDETKEPIQLKFTTFSVINREHIQEHCTNTKRKSSEKDTQMKTAKPKIRETHILPIVQLSNTLANCNGNRKNLLVPESESDPLNITESDLQQQNAHITSSLDKTFSLNTDDLPKQNVKELEHSSENATEVMNKNELDNRTSIVQNITNHNIINDPLALNKNVTVTTAPINNTDGLKNVENLNTTLNEKNTEDDKTDNIAQLVTVEVTKSTSIENIHSKTSTPEFRDDTSLQKTNDSVPIIENVAIKTEVLSEDEMMNVPNANVPNVNIPDISSAEKTLSSNIGTIQIKNINKLKSLSLNKKKVDRRERNQFLSEAHFDFRRQTQRARKSFPSKSEIFAPELPVVWAPYSGNSSTRKCPRVYGKSKLMNVHLSKSNEIKLTPVPALAPMSNNQTFQTNNSSTTSSTVVSGTYTNTLNSNATSTSTINPNCSILNVTNTNVTNTNVAPTCSVQQSSNLSSTVVTSSCATVVTSSYLVPSTISIPSAMPIQPSIVQTTPLTSNNVQTDGQHMLSGFVTPSLAAAITDTIVRGPPKLASRPSGALRSEGDYVFPSDAGPVHSTLIANSFKMTDFFRSVIEDTLGDMGNSGILEAKIQLLKLELEKLKHNHVKELAELKNNTDLMLCEMRNSMENEKTRIIVETRKQCELERIRAVEEAKKKQWCANCGKEAQFYCCWNTSYCDYPCQQKHWSRHISSCAQKDNCETNAQKLAGMKANRNTTKDKEQSKSKDIPIHRATNVFNRNLMAAPRNSMPIQTLIPITTNACSRYTVLNRDGGWELMQPGSSNFHHTSAGLIMADQQNMPQMRSQPLVVDPHLGKKII